MKSPAPMLGLSKTANFLTPSYLFARTPVTDWQRQATNPSGFLAPGIFDPAFVSFPQTPHPLNYP